MSLRIEFTNGAIEPQAVMANADEHPSAHGAEALFFGKVRDLNHGRRVRAVSYDVFRPLADRVMEEICAEARARWGETLSIRFAHASGRLAVGEISVGIGVTSPHRAEAFEACRYVIEELKKRAPIWKQEHYVDGDSGWLQGHALCGH